MPLIPLKIPAGVYRTGTDYEFSGRWRDASLIRWSNGSMRPVGGWEAKFDLSSEITAKARSVFVWKDNSANTNLVVGTVNELVYVNSTGAAYDITPTGFNAGADGAVINTAYGGGTFSYGGSRYGVKQPSTGTYQEVDVWSLDNWGEYLVGVCTSDGKIYEWQLDTGTPAAQVANSPTSNKSIIVTEERFIFALGAGGNPRKVQWCDREDNTLWTPSATNEAGDLELQTSGEIMCAVRMRGRTLILTSTDAHAATYIGAPYVYGFERVGTACGIVSRNSLVAADQGAFWMGKEGFFMFDGSVARPMPCDVQDYVFENINANQITKVNAVQNSEYGEIWWFYPSEDSTECDRYVSYNYIENHWGIGVIDRVSGVDQGIYDEPLWFGSNGVLYEHERYGLPHGGVYPYAETSAISIGNGDSVMKVNQIIGDEGSAGDVDISFKTRFHPNDTERSYGPYDLTSMPTSARFTGRQVRMRVQATGNEDWRVGVMRINAESGGRR